MNRSETEIAAPAGNREAVTRGSLAPHVVGARLRFEALFCERQWNYVVSPDALKLTSSEAQTTVRFAAQGTDVFTQIAIIPARSREAGGLEELCASGEPPPFKVGSIRVPDGSLVLYSEVVWPTAFPLGEFVAWFDAFHVFVRPLTGWSSDEDAD